MSLKVKKISFLGVSAALAVILSYLEAMIPPIFAAVPGIKLGLANIVIIAVFYKFSFSDAAIIHIVRLLVTSMLFGNAMTLVYSVAGAALSLIMMFIFKKLDFFSMVGVSIIGAVSHNIGQVFVAVFLFERSELWYYLIMLTIFGTVAGVFIGIAGALVYKSIRKINFERK